MIYLTISPPQLQKEIVSMCWKLSDDFIDWCDTNLKEPYGLHFLRQIDGGYSFARYDPRSYLLAVSEEDGALIMMRHSGVEVADINERLEPDHEIKKLFNV